MQCSLPSLAPRDAPDRQRELDVAKRGKPGKQITVLSDVSDAGVQAVHRSAIAEHGATGGANQPRGQSQQRRFSTTRGAHNGCDPPWRNVEADAVQRQHLVLLADKSKPDIRKPYRRQLFSSVDHKCPSITSFQCHALPSLRPAKTVRSHSPTLYSSAQEPIRPQFALAGGQGSRNHLGFQRDLDVVLPHGGGHSAVTRVAIPIALQGPFHSLRRDTRKLLFEHIDDLAEVRREQIIRLTQGLGNATDQIGLFASEFWSDKGNGVGKFL